MKLASFFVVCGLSASMLAACGDDSEDEESGQTDAELICQTLDDCNAAILIGSSVSECIEQVDEGVASAKRDCANCVDGKACATLSNGACDEECAALFP